MESTHLTIIGGGVIGLTTAYVYSRKHPGKEIFLLEKNNYLGEEQTGRNSGVLHSGILNSPGSLKSKLCNIKRLKYFAKEHCIPYLETGKITVATTQEQLSKLTFYLNQAKINGETNARLINSDEIKKLEPNIHALAAIYTPSTGIIDCASYVKKLTNLISNQVQVLTNTKVEQIIPQSEKFLLKVNNKNDEFNFKSDFLVNAAGLFADELAIMINPKFPYKIKPIRGEYMKFNKKKRNDLYLNGLCVYPIPTKMPGNIKDQYGKPRIVAGTHLTPTLDLLPGDKFELSNYELIGPLAVEVENKTDYKINRKPPEEFIKDLPFMPNLKVEDLEKEYAGIQAKIENYADFVIEKDKKHPNAVHVLAESPGLSSSLDIGEFVTLLLTRNI